MGYTLAIGEEQVYYDSEGGGGECCCCEKVRHENAPSFGEPTDCENQRWPSYRTWAEFADFVGLKYLFFDREHGLIASHPGSVAITGKHKEIIDKAYNDYKEKYPAATATYGIKNKDDPLKTDETNPVENSWLCRLEWLKYWVDWSLKNCKKPIFYNS